MAVSVFDLSRIGIAPSTSHAVGSMGTGEWLQGSPCGDGSHYVLLDNVIKTMRENRRRHEDQVQGSLARRAGGQHYRVPRGIEIRSLSLRTEPPHYVL